MRGIKGGVINWVGGQLSFKMANTCAAIWFPIRAIAVWGSKTVTAENYAVAYRMPP